MFFIFHGIKPLYICGFVILNTIFHFLFLFVFFKPIQITQRFLLFWIRFLLKFLFLKVTVENNKKQEYKKIQCFSWYFFFYFPVSVEKKIKPFFNLFFPISVFRWISDQQSRQLINRVSHYRKKLLETI